MFDIRKIVPTDREEIFAISSKIWEGNDYVPVVFEKWVADNKGEFTAVLKEGKIVGFGRFAYLTPTDVWLEGLRADPDANVKGIGRSLAAYYLEILRQDRQLTSVRFSTYFENMASITSAEKIGFQAALKMSHKYCGFDEEERIAMADMTINDRFVKDTVEFQEICNYVESSEFLKKSRSFICLGWVVYPYSKEILKRLFIDNKQYLVHKTGTQISGLLLYDIANPSSENSPNNICFLKAANDEIAKELIRTAKIITAKKGLFEVQCKVPDIKELRVFFNKEGFNSRQKEDDFIVYEFPLKMLKQDN